MAIDRVDDIPISTAGSDGDGEEIETGQERDEGDASGRLDQQPPAAGKKRKRDGGRRPVARPPGSGKKRKPARFRLFIWLLAPLLVTALYGVGSYFLVPALIKGPLAGLLSDRLDRPVTAGRVIFAPFTLRLYLHEIVIGSVRGAADTEAHFLACDAVRCRLSLERILRGRLLCDEISIEQLTMRIRREADGYDDLVDVLNIFAVPVSSGIDPVWPSKLEAGELSVHSGTVDVRDELTGKQYLIEQVEMYLPPAGPDRGERRPPEVSAVVNGSPVRAEAVRMPDREGKEETGLTLHVREVMLGQYLDAFSHGEGQYQLTDGQADIDLQIVFPRQSEAGGRFILSGVAAVTGVKIVDPEAGPVFVVPDARLDFEYLPSAGNVLYRDVVLTKPELTVFRSGGEGKGRRDPAVGVFFNAIDALFLPGGRFRVERLQAAGGTVRFASPAPQASGKMWSNVAFTLDAAGSGTKGEEEGKADAASFTLQAVDRQEGREGRLAADGRILPGGGSSGKFSSSGIDFREYRDVLPLSGLDLEKGVGSFAFAYEFKPGVVSDSALNGAVLHLRDGSLDAAGFAVRSGKTLIAAGKNLRCDDFATDGLARRSTCGTLTLTDSEIHAAPLLPLLAGRPRDVKGLPRLAIDTLRISGSRLHVPLPASLCSTETGLVFNNVTLDADNLLKDGPGGNNITGSAAIGSKGEVRIAGGYAAAGGQGSLQLSMRHVDFELFKPCLAPVIVPLVNKGTLHLQGDVFLPAGEFSGQAWMSDLEAGGPAGPRVSWQLASSDKVVLRLTPPHLDLGEIMIRKPSVNPGLIDPEGPLRNFFHSGKPSFDRLSIDRISIEDGRFALPWPVILPGYQPEVTGIDGTVTSVGQDAMPFSFRGTMNGAGDFVLDGTAESGGVRSFLLEMADVRLTPFMDFFRSELGMAVDSAGAAWKMSMRSSGDQTEVDAAVTIRNCAPEADTPFLPVLALLIDENRQLRMTLTENLSAGEERPLLLELFQRYLLRQSVRADISKQLVLKEQLPLLELPGHVSFAPGSAVPDDPAALAAYGELLARRPFLRLRLQPSIAGEGDGKALQAVLQQEADRKREEENRRRTLEKMQREQREMERLAAIREGKATVEAEEIDPGELVVDLDPLPYVRVEITEEMLMELGRKRMNVVRDYLVNRLAVDPERISGSDRYETGEPQVKIFLDPFVPGGGNGRSANENG